MNHSMRLKEKPFGQIWNGEKTIELRLYDEKRQKVKVGDTVSFINEAFPEEVITAEVVALHPFGSFEELYSSLPLEKCGYKGCVETAKAEDMEAYCTEEEQKLYGVVGIEFNVISKHK